MGISKLNQYIESNFHDWKRISLKDCPVVIDGSGLPFHLSKQVDLDWRFGGQYPALIKVSAEFFDALRQSNVNPIHIVLDGTDRGDKLETILERNKSNQRTVIRALSEPNNSTYSCRVTPPLLFEVFRKFIEDYNKIHDNIVKIYGGDKEADSLGVAIANHYNCPLLGNDSDYFIADLHAGYIPFNKVSWRVPGEIVTGKIFYRNLFAKSLGIDSDLVIAIPAIVGNDSIPNLVDQTSLKRVRDNPRYRGDDTKKGIDFIRRQRSMRHLESRLKSFDDRREAWHRFRDSRCKALKMYEEIRPFNEGEFRRVGYYKTNTGKQCPDWIVEQYRNFKLSIKIFSVLLNGETAHRVVADDCDQPSANILSCPIRQEMYGIMEVRGSVREVIRVGKELDVQEVGPKPSELSIFQMHAAPQHERIRKLCSVLMCDPSTLQSLDHEWYIPIASVCYWSKTTGITRNHLKLRALLLCFAECYNGVEYSLGEPVFSTQNLHILTQWQCVYRDTIFLNQILALPLPYLSPAYLFDGRRVSFYQQAEMYLEQQLVGKVLNLYDQLLEAVNKNF